jgi:hypothetical protein
MLPDAKMVIHLRTAALRELPLRRSLEEAAARIAPEAVASFAEVGKDCGLGWAEVDELVMSGDTAEHDILLVASMREPEQLVRCLAKREDNGKTAELWGLPGAELDGDEVAVAKGNRLLAGSRRRVREAVEGPPARAGANDVAVRLDGSDESLFRMYVVTPDSGYQATALAIDGDDTELDLTISVDLASTEAADRTVNSLRGIIDGTRSYVRTAEATTNIKALGRLLKRVEVSRRVGGRVSMNLDAVGTAEQQAEAFTGFLDFAKTSADIMRRQDSARIARINVMAIAERLAAHADHDRRGFFKVPTFPDAVPPTPSTMPVATLVGTTAADWSHPTWRALTFAIEGAVDRSYTIELSPDKRIATVRARGDLDGDGKLALHEISVRIDFKGKVTIDPEIRTENELE